MIIAGPDMHKNTDEMFDPPSSFPPFVCWQLDGVRPALPQSSQDQELTSGHPGMCWYLTAHPGSRLAAG